MQSQPKVDSAYREKVLAATYRHVARMLKHGVCRCRWCGKGLTKRTGRVVQLPGSGETYTVCKPLCDDTVEMRPVEIPRQRED